MDAVYFNKCSSSINFSEFKPTTYSTNKELQIYNLSEVTISSDNQLVFIRPENEFFYNVLDLECGTTTEIHVDLMEFQVFNEFRLLPILGQDTFVMLSRLVPSDHFWTYQFAHFKIDDANNTLKRLDEWTEIARSFEDSGSCFVAGQKLYTLCKTIEHNLKMQTFDIELCVLEDNQTVFTGRYTNETWCMFESKFKTLSKGYIYSFRCFRSPADSTLNYSELYRYFNQIIKTKADGGSIQHTTLNNDLKCLNINTKAYDSYSSFSVDGLWLDRNFHLTVRIEDPPATNHPSNYFAMLNVDSKMWKKIKVDQISKNPHHPIKLVITNNERLILLRPFSTYKNFEKLPNIKGKAVDDKYDHHIDIYRIPLRIPEKFKTICSAEFTRIYGHQSRIAYFFSTFLS